MSIYLQALNNNPVLAEARAKALSANANIIITRANLLPNLSANANGTLSHNNQGNPSENGEIAQYGLTLSETIFNYADWLNLDISKLSSRAANANYAFSLQALMVNVSKAYFNVAKAQALLKIAKANQNALKTQLTQTRLRFKVGLKQTVDVNNAKAAYDLSRESVITARASLQDALSQLQQLTGKSYPSVAILKQTLPLISPQPKKLSTWLSYARKNNLSLIANRLQQAAARININSASAERYPNLDATASLSGNQSRNNGIQTTNTNTASLGIGFNWPIYQGGLVGGEVKKAESNYALATAIYLQNDRAVIAQTQQGYINVLADIENIRAGREAIQSNKASLQSTITAYEAGTRNILDVLNARQTLFDAKRQYIASIYAYVIDYLSLKQAAGTLTLDDLRMINGWLNRRHPE